MAAARRAQPAHLSEIVGARCFVGVGAAQTLAGMAEI